LATTENVTSAVLAESSTTFDTVALDFGRSQVRFDVAEQAMPPAPPFRSAAISSPDA